MEINREIIRPLYRKWKAAVREVNKISIDFEILSEENIIPSRLLGSQFIPEEMGEYIRVHGGEQCVYRAHIGGRPVTIYIMEFDEGESMDHKSWVERMLVWLYIGYQYSANQCSEELAIYLYLTPFEKRLPDSIHETMGPKHVNTGVTYRCSRVGEIVIYRKEEWFKVFIHETFHALGLDLEHEQVDTIREKVTQMFPVASKHDVAEAYTETWARIIHTIFVSFYKSKGIVTFEKRLFENLTRERDHSLNQMHKVLHFIGVPYDSLIGRSHGDYLRRRAYRENSNVFSYYVICGSLMNNPNEFLEWCDDHNNNRIFNFATDTDQFAELIRKCSRIKSPKEFYDTSMSTKMTVLEIN